MYYTSRDGFVQSPRESYPHWLRQSPSDSPVVPPIFPDSPPSHETPIIPPVIDDEELNSSMPPPIIPGNPTFRYGKGRTHTSGPSSPWSSTAVPPRAVPSIILHPMFSSSQQSGLRWNLLYPAAYVHIEGVDPAAWSNMQKAQATSPPLPTLRLSIQGLPWIITVRASQPHYGVSCSDVIKTISEFMDQLVDEHEFNKFPYETRRMVSMNYNRNRLQAQDVLGALGLGEGVKRLDWLGEETMVWGVQQDQRLVRETSGDAYSPVSFVLIRKREYGIHCHSQPRY